ncbi:hypothetical protein THRCLA_21428 [Thraustotheca clavata]|uniref:Transcription factor CBF/NF-Y/archaeal histone domain-containing protein n=1 Tax=Thraustotheca clavata TaxID=74557 RepID=A0A1V9ZWL2_9STRA|nr:hypothetical protein THRCLA_21428 [Thraustotheca clavata]
MELPTTSPRHGYYNGNKSQAASSGLHSTPASVQAGTEGPLSAVAQPKTPVPSGRMTTLSAKSQSALDGSKDSTTATLLNLLYAFHNANTSEEVILSLQTLFTWFQKQTYHPTQTPPGHKGPFLPIQMLRHAKNEFVQCAQIKQSRQPYVWTNIVAKQYAIILQHLLVAIQAQSTQLQARANPPTPHLQSQLTVSIHEAHAQYSRQQQTRPGPLSVPSQHHVAHSSSNNHTMSSSYHAHKVTQVNNPPRKPEYTTPSNSSLVVKVPKNNSSIDAKPPSSFGISMPPTPSTSNAPATYQESPFFVDMTMRSAVRPPSAGVDEEYLYMPVRNITKIMKSALPNDPRIKIADDAKEFMQECVTEFLLYLTSEARDQAVYNKRGKTTVTGSDTLRAFYNLGFTPYGDVLSVYNEKIKAVQEEAAKIKIEKKAAKTQLLTSQTPPASFVFKSEPSH